MHVEVNIGSVRSHLVPFIIIEGREVEDEQQRTAFCHNKLHGT